MFLGLERLMKAFGIAAARHHTAGKLVDDNDLVIADDVVLVTLKQRMRAQCLIAMVHQRCIGRVIERAFFQEANFGE